MAEVVGLELRNVVVKYPLEKSHRFPGIQPNSGHRDYSSLSCDVGDTQLAEQGDKATSIGTHFNDSAKECSSLLGRRSSHLEAPLRGAFFGGRTIGLAAS